MSLKTLDLSFLERTVDLPGGQKLAVRGIDYSQVIRLVHGHRPAMEDLFGYVTFGADGTAKIDTATSAALSIVDLAPDFFAEVIALAAGDGDQESIEIARGMPVGLQTVLLENIAAATFESAGGPKKFVEIVVGVLRQLSGQTQDVAT